MEKHESDIGERLGLYVTILVMAASSVVGVETCRSCDSDPFRQEAYTRCLEFQRSFYDSTPPAEHQAAMFRNCEHYR